MFLSSQTSLTVFMSSTWTITRSKPSNWRTWAAINTCTGEATHDSPALQHTTWLFLACGLSIKQQRHLVYEILMMWGEKTKCWQVQFVETKSYVIINPMFAILGSWKSIILWNIFIFTDNSSIYFTQSQELSFKLHKNHNFQFNLSYFRSVVN